MENELTPRLQIPYPKVRDMEDDVKPNATPEPMVSKEAEEEILRRAQQRLSVRQRAVQEAWEELNRQKERRGEKVTDEEREIQKRAIEKGIPPQAGGSGDGKFENFPVSKYENTPLGIIGQRLQAAGERDAITLELIEEARQQAINTVGRGVDEDTFNRFIEDMEAALQGRQTPEQEIQQRQGEAGQAQTGGQQEGDLELRLARMQERRESSTTNPRSIQQLARVIAIDEGEDRWGKTGRFPLLDKDNKLNKQNFIKWFRERMMYHHLNNSRDEQLQLGNIVGVDNEFGSTISVFSMDRNRAQYFKDETTDKVLDDLAFQMKMELWLFGKMRNYDLQYQKYMNSDSDLPKFLSQIHDLEEITQPGSLQTIMSLPKEFGVEGDTSVGDAIRKSYEIYYYASDLDMLKKVLGPNSIFFKKDTFRNAFRIIEQKSPGAQISSEAEGFIASIFDGDQINEAKFITEMNPFNLKNKPEFNKQIMREMVRQVVAQKYNFDNGLNDTVGLDENGNLDLHTRDLVRKDLEYAEAFAWVLTRWTGAAARNDTSAIGFDSFTKTIKFRDYRQRQSSETRAGAFGNEYDLPVFKGLTADFFNGITVEKIQGEKENLTPFEVFRIISTIEDDPHLSQEDKIKEKEKWAKRLNFQQYIQRSYSADHINRAFEVFHSMMGAEEMKLEEIVKKDPFQGVLLDRGKFEEQVKEKFLKPIRYAYTTYGQLDFGKKTRVQTGGFNPGERPIYKDVTMAESLFGPEVTRELRPLAEKAFPGEDKETAWQKYLSGPGRSMLWKRAAMARIALQIKSHRYPGNGYQFFDEAMVNKFYEALETIKSVEINEDDDGTDVSYAKRFLTPEDIKWIRKMSGTTQGWLFFNDVLIRHGGLGLIKGTWGGLNDFVKDIFK